MVVSYCLLKKYNKIIYLIFLSIALMYKETFFTIFCFFTIFFAYLLHFAELFAVSLCYFQELKLKSLEFYKCQLKVSTVMMLRKKLTDKVSSELLSSVERVVVVLLTVDLALSLRSMFRLKLLSVI